MLSEFLKQARKDANVSQKDIAQKLGYGSNQFCSNWERGLSAPPITSIKQVAKVLNVDPQLLLNEVIAFKIAEIVESANNDYRRSV